MSVTWPSGQKFAFTIFDDTDWATLEKVRPVYDLLADLAMRTTKSVWVFRGGGEATNGGSTCEDRDYLRWLLGLQKQGFEIGLHNPAPSTSSREQMRHGLARFRDLFGDQMPIHCNHVGCLEAIYWGDARLSGWRRAVYNMVTSGKNRGLSRGHIVGDPLFWGDFCQERVRYVRNFVFKQLNTLAVCPEMPYHDPARPYVNFWFASTDAGTHARFLDNFTPERIDRLVESGGLCIAYAHFAGGFVHDGKLDSEFRRRMEYIASKSGWFAPVSDVLEYLRGDGDRDGRVISPVRRAAMEAQWLAEKVHRGGQKFAVRRLQALQERWNGGKRSGANS
jgi:hypothetical protein